MLGAKFFAAFGALCILLGGLGLRSLNDHSPVRNIYLVYLLLSVGVLLVGLNIFVLISRFRYYGNLRGTPSVGGSLGPDSDASSYPAGDSHGHGGDCGHAGADGGCGGDGGGGH